MKMTFQPKKRQRAKVHGFRARMKTRPHFQDVAFLFMCNRSGTGKMPGILKRSDGCL